MAVGLSRFQANHGRWFSATPCKRPRMPRLTIAGELASLAASSGRFVPTDPAARIEPGIWKPNNLCRTSCDIELKCLSFMFCWRSSSVQPQRSRNPALPAAASATTKSRCPVLDWSNPNDPLVGASRKPRNQDAPALDEAVVAEGVISTARGRLPALVVRAQERPRRLSVEDDSLPSSAAELLAQTE
jgi:hypothetical protein